MTLDAVNAFEAKYRAIIDIVVKPVVGLLIVAAFSAYTLWLNANYTQKSEFNVYAKEQREMVEVQNKETNAKLETIISNQVSFNEQMKTVNLLLAHQEGQMNSLDSRITYLERKPTPNGRGQ